jgi:hypothetical protein
MQKFKEYFKFPLKMWDCMDSKVFTSDNKMAFDWMIDIPRKYKETLLDKINGVESRNFQIKKEFWHDDGIIYCKFLGGEREGQTVRICCMRGWGMLTGVGGHNLHANTAAEIQDAFAEYIVKQLNNYV